MDCFLRKISFSLPKKAPQVCRSICYSAVSSKTGFITTISIERATAIFLVNNKTSQNSKERMRELSGRIKIFHIQFHLNQYQKTKLFRNVYHSATMKISRVPPSRTLSPLACINLRKTQVATNTIRFIISLLIYNAT